MNNSKNAFLETEPLGVLMRKYSIPCIISLVVGALYNIVDQIFIANASYLGSNGNAANTVVFPLTVLALGIAVLIGDGTCAYVSISLGQKEPENASKSVGNAIVLCIVSSLILMSVYLAFPHPLLTLFGGDVNETAYSLAREYFFYISLGIPFYMFGQAMNPIIRSDGSPRFAMVATVSGGLVNVVLDPIFIFTLHKGMAGAAVATVLGQILTAVLSIIYLTRMKAIKIDKSSFILKGRIIRQFLSLGLTSFLAQASLVVSMAAVQSMCTKYGALDPVFGQTEYSQIPVAVLGIVMKFFQIAISVAIGTAAGCIPVVGYNIGAGRADRAKKLFEMLLTVEVIVGFVALFIVEVFPDKLIALFGASGESEYYTTFAIRCFRIYLCTLPLATLNKGAFIFLQAMGRALESTVISMLRELVFGVSLPILLPIFFGLNGVLYSFPAADILTFIIALFIIVRTFRELSRQADAQKKSGAAAESEAVTDAAAV
ncbi:MAG: MATE family efflux transporter [Eubacterium sp.]|jgi:putative MATE family efflux protein